MISWLVRNQSASAILGRSAPGILADSRERPGHGLYLNANFVRRRTICDLESTAIDYRSFSFLPNPWDGAKDAGRTLTLVPFHTYVMWSENWRLIFAIMSTAASPAETLTESSTMLSKVCYMFISGYCANSFRYPVPKLAQKSFVRRKFQITEGQLGKRYSKLRMLFTLDRKPVSQRCSISRSFVCVRNGGLC